jgi:membrane fusion protein (multidrug efflux system)
MRRVVRGRHLLFGVSLTLLTAVAVFFGWRWWEYYHVHVSTDDAYVDADVALITPRVAGTIVELPVEDNWRVQRGDLVARLDPVIYALHLQEAEAAVAAAEQTIDEARAGVFAADDQTALAEAELELARRDNARIEQLRAKRVVSEDDLDRSRTQLLVSQARLGAARQEAARARATLGIPVDGPTANAPAVRRAVAARDEAALELSYTELRAPIDGVVATRTVQLGQRVETGQAMMRVVPLTEVYIEANFKETQLSDVRIGQPVTVVADIYPDYRYQGVVDGLAPGTGAAFALLPPENATGNWIKVVQRLPLKVRLNAPPPADHPLRVGLSVVATIDVQSRTGSLLVPLSQAARSAPPAHQKKDSASTKPTS